MLSKQQMKENGLSNVLFFLYTNEWFFFKQYNKTVGMKSIWKCLIFL